MEERKGKRHLQGMRNVLLAFAFCFICALFVGVSPYMRQSRNGIIKSLKPIRISLYGLR